MRDLEQVINEGNAIIEAKDNQIGKLIDEKEYLLSELKTVREINNTIVNENINMLAFILVLLVVLLVAIIAFI